MTAHGQASHPPLTPMAMPSQTPDAEPPEPSPHQPVRPAHRPVWRPWQPATVDPETIGHWGNKHRTPTPSLRPTHRHFAIAGAVVALALTGVMVWQAAPSQPPPTAVPAPSPPAPAPPPATAEVARHAADTARAFLAAATVDERARFVRHPEITRSRMQAWHSADRPITPLHVLSFHDRWAHEPVGPHAFVMLYMEMADFTTRAIALEPTPDGSLLVDWESFESWSEIPWTAFLESTPTEALEFRVITEHDTYFNFNFSDPDAWACFRLTDPDNRAHAWGYCAVDSDAADALTHLLRRQRRHGTTQAKAILRLRFPAANSPEPQVLIEELVQDSWLKPDP